MVTIAIAELTVEVQLVAGAQVEVEIEEEIDPFRRRHPSNHPTQGLAGDAKVIAIVTERVIVTRVAGDVLVAEAKVVQVIDDHDL